MPCVGLDVTWLWMEQMSYGSRDSSNTVVLVTFLCDSICRPSFCRVPTFYCTYLTAEVTGNFVETHQILLFSAEKLASHPCILNIISGALALKLLPHRNVLVQHRIELYSMHMG